MRHLGLTLVTLIAVQVVAQEAPAPGAAAGRVAILDNDSYFRGYTVCRTPVQVSSDGQVKPCLETVGRETRPVADFQSPLPPPDWMKPEFDDSTWERQRSPVERGPGDLVWAAKYTAAANAMVCLRSRFAVSDPANVQDLSLGLEYVGGVVVYVNGQEVGRGSLPAGDLKPDVLAEKYPDDLYCLPGGKFVTDPRKAKEGFARRYRQLAAVAVPAKLLRKGTNVLALELRRAPINEAAAAAPGLWATVGLKSVSLSAAAGSAIVPNVTRPKGVQVWNCAPFETVTAFDYSDGGELRPIALSVPRNGTFSGRLAISSDQAITGLKVAVSGLAKTGGKEALPSGTVRVRCAESAVAAKSWVGQHRFDALPDAIPASIPPANASQPGEQSHHFANAYDTGLPVERKKQVAGAVAPLWLTVRVPRDAKAGAYEGTVSLAADGLPAVSVPLRVTVADWALPDPKDFRVHSFAYFSEDTVAQYYGAAMWSERHFELMGKSLSLMAEVGSRQAIANLAINFYGDTKKSSNEQSLVRWIRQSDGSYKYDFTLFDKYLDLVARTIGKPTILRVNCWGEVIRKDGKLVNGNAVSSGTVHDAAACVTLLDPATGKTEPMLQPTPGTEESFTFWKPVLDEVRRKVEARGWWDVTALGHNSYCYPVLAPVVDVAKRIWPDGAWSYTAHNGSLGQRFEGTVKEVSMPVRQSDAVWTATMPKLRGARALLQPRPAYCCYTWRSWMRDFSDLAVLRSIGEDEILRGHDGVSDFGADLFPLKAPNGHLYALGNGRGTGGPSCSTLAMLAPGNDGPIGTERFEMLREGMEIAEATLFLESALLERKISGDLEKRVNALLDARGDAHVRAWLDGGRYERDGNLISIAGEVAAAIGKK